MTDYRVPMSSPNLTAAEIDAVHEVLQTRYLSIGPKIRAFEDAIASYTGAAHAVGVNSGTSALHLAVIAAEVKERDLVLTTPFSFIASANCVLYERGIPVFVDVDSTTGNISPDGVAEAAAALTGAGNGRRRWLPPALRDRPLEAGPLKALLPVHAFGQPAHMDPIMAVAAKHNIIVIEDACEALGSEYQGRPAGTLGDVGTFAFYPNKQITTAEGGMIVTNNAGWADLFRSLRNQGRDIFDAWLNHTRLGYNYRMDELSAALGLVQMKRVDELIQRREQVAAWYQERLAGTDSVVVPTIVPTTTRISWFVYVVRIEPPANRDEVLRRLDEMGIPSRPYFTPIHLQPFYRDLFGYRRGDFPVTERLGDVSLALPFSSVMTEMQVDQVCDALTQAVRRTVH